MCNLSTGIEEKATEKFILNMYKKGYTCNTYSCATVNV